MIKNIFNFIYKYRIIVILFLLVLVLVVLKIVTNQNLTQNSNNLTPTLIPTISNISPIYTQPEYIFDANGNKKISFEELKKMDSKTLDEYYLNNLTDEEKKQIPDDYFEP